MVDTDIMDISYDGVKVSNSCGRSFEVLSGKFKTCRQVYPLCIGQAEKGFSETMKAEEVSKKTLTNLRKEGVHVCDLVMDAPKRAGEKISIANYVFMAKENSIFFFLIF